MHDLNEKLQAIADSYTGKGLYAGVGWQVEQAGERIAGGTSGTSDDDRSKPLQADAIYRIYSMTKPVVSFMALMLVERGQLRLSDFVMQYIPAFGATRVLCDGGTEVPRRPMTVEDLLTHRSGLSYDFVPWCPVAEKYKNIDLLNRVDKSLAEFADLLAEFPLASHPGTEWRYSLSTDVLARVLEVASGQPLDELLEANIFAPLGMVDTGYCVPPEKQSRLLPLYGFESIDLSYSLPPPHKLELLDGEAIYPSTPGHKALRGGHGLFSTCSDYTRFATMLLDGKAPDGRAMLSPAMHCLMQANRMSAHQLPLRLGPLTYAGYGFNLLGRIMIDLGQAMSLTAPGEFGWEGAAGTYFWVDPQNRLVGVLMTQFLATYLPMRDDMRSAVYAALPL